LSPEPIHNSGYYDDASSKISHGLPPTSPNKKKIVDAHQKLPKQQVKPPSNYGKPSRPLSYNQIAPPQKKGSDLGGQLNRDKSTGGILNRGQLQQFDSMSQNVPQD
jgi:hypothetical protein